MEKMEKKLVVFCFFMLINLISLSCLQARDSYSIKDGTIKFSISSSEGIYPTVHIMKDTQKIDSINACNNSDRCTGTLNLDYLIKPDMLGTYLLAYYAFDNYDWRYLNFTISGRASEEGFSGSDFIQGSEESTTKIATVKTICWLSTRIIGDYNQCISEYI